MFCFFVLLFFVFVFWLVQVEEILCVYNWNDYIDLQVFEFFQKDIGICVEYYIFVIVEELDKVLCSGEVIDVVVFFYDILLVLLKDNLLWLLDFIQLFNCSYFDC